MSTTFKTGWLLNDNGEKFAPKTLLSQVSTNDGVLLERKIETDLLDIKTELNTEITVERARIDNLIAMEESATTTDVERELADIKIKTDGTTAATAGDAVREQIGRLSSEIADIADGVSVYIKSDNLYDGEYEEGMKVDSKGQLVSNSDGFSTTSFIPVEKGRTIYVTRELSDGTRDGSNIGLYAFYNEKKEYVDGNISYWQPSLYIPTDKDVYYVRLTIIDKVFTTQKLGISYDEPMTIYEEYFKPYYAPAEKENVEKNTDDIRILNDEKIQEYQTGGLGEILLDKNTIVPFSTRKRQVTQKNIGLNILAVNHDDMFKSDYETTRRIYAKYGFNANFNYILKPFKSVEAQNEMVKNVKMLIADGNEIGLHAIFDESYWWMNKCFDVKPNSSFSFAPTLSDIKTVVADGKNVFGQIVNLDLTLSSYGFHDLHSDYANKKLSELTKSDYVNIIASYTVRFANKKYTGLDLDGVSRTWYMFQWIEHWYNRLIDNTLGYSSVAIDVNSVFSNDYEVPSDATQSQYYPSNFDLETGHIVFFDDTNNPNYETYKKVGRVNKGIFKGCASYCNYEVRERLVMTAKAVFKYYFGTDKFTSFNRHGVVFVDCQWEKDGIPYDNANKTIISGEFGRVYSSLNQKFENGFEILLRSGIKMSGHNTPLNQIFESQKGLYYGQKDNRSPYFNRADVISYLSLMGDTSSFDGKLTTVDDVKAIMDGEQDWIKFAYENASKPVTKNGKTKYIHKYIRTILEKIRECKGTGKIPVLSLDTITNDGSTASAVQLLCKFCYENDIDIIPFEKAREIALNTKRGLDSNYFPNPRFSQMLIDYFGESSSARAYLPDGWSFKSYADGISFDVSEAENSRVLEMKSEAKGSNYIETKLYGLPAGHYELSLYAKREGNASKIYVYKKKNSDLVSERNPISTITPTDEYEKYTVEFDVEEPYRVSKNNSVENQYCDGYENNVSNIIITMGMDNNMDNNTESISIYSPVLKLIN